MEIPPFAQMGIAQVERDCKNSIFQYYNKGRVENPIGLNGKEERLHLTDRKL